MSTLKKVMWFPGIKDGSRAPQVVGLHKPGLFTLLWEIENINFTRSVVFVQHEIYSSTRTCHVVHGTCCDLLSK